MTRPSYLVIGLCLASIGSIFIACLIGSTPLSTRQVLAAMFGTGETGDSVIIWSIRLPRALAAFLSGAALGLGGAALQGLMRNPLAEPGILGVSASASLMATLALFYGLAALSVWVLPLAAITGAIIATLLLVFAALITPSIVTLILIGVGLSSFSGALMSLVLNFAPNPFSLSDMINWMLGTVANRSFEEISLALPFWVMGATILFTNRRGLCALTLGEEAASGVGLNLIKLRVLVVLGTGLLTGASVSLAGTIGFVGIVAPHLMRPLTAYDPARSLLPSALMGGLILVLADIGVRILPTQQELKLGVVAALIGAPIFVWIIIQRRAIDG